MSENDLPRYTWVMSDFGVFEILEKTGLYGHQSIGSWLPPMSGRNHPKVLQSHKAIANAICEYLSENDKQQAET